MSFFKIDKENIVMKEQLKNCNNLNDIIKVVNKFYDLDQKLGTVSETVVKSAIQNVINTCRIKERKKHF
ncbi:hypothetical protein CMK13_14180 [Candidatus Poribacteria bacterium]|nr:hypothetical protein [Candidatus Poribacteria bacterium]OUV99032.1 MAG: hypothetical protein CBD16_09060 [Betaproteobacteria bacterium TMED156]|tara:strand:+ start:929 stop:1135 length:207 start_codon:yes stop_codon:yes gene_type:complete